MTRALKIKVALKFPTIIFDQSIFKTAAEIIWKDPSMLKECILILGTFHTIMMYMTVISKLFKDAEVRDVLGDHSFSTFAKYVSVCIREYEMLVFRRML